MKMRRRPPAALRSPRSPRAAGGRTHHDVGERRWKSRVCNHGKTTLTLPSNCPIGLDHLTPFQKTLSHMKTHSYVQLQALRIRILVLSSRYAQVRLLLPTVYLEKYIFLTCISQQASFKRACQKSGGGMATAVFGLGASLRVRSSSWPWRRCGGRGGRTPRRRSCRGLLRDRADPGPAGPARRT